MILRLHHHWDSWQKWELKAQGPGVVRGAWSESWRLWAVCARGWGALWTGFLHSCEMQHLISQPTTETTIASVSQLVKT